MNVIFSRSLWWVESRKKKTNSHRELVLRQHYWKTIRLPVEEDNHRENKESAVFQGERESLCKDERRLKTLVSFHFPCGHLSSLLPIRPMCYGSQDHPQSDPVSMYRFLRDCIFNFEKKDRSSQRFSWSIVADDTIISPPSSLYENLIIACCCSA